MKKGSSKKDKRAYQPPRLDRLGKLATITRTTAKGGTKTDGGAPMTKL